MSAPESNGGTESGEASGRTAEPRAVLDVLQEAGDELRMALEELYQRSQRQDQEARLQFSQEVQQAQFEQQKADAEAHWEMMEGLRTASESAEDRTLQSQRSYDYQRSVQDRARETEQRVAEAGRAYSEAAEAAQKEFAEDLEEIHRAHIARLKEIWVSLDPDSVAPEELAALGHCVAVAAQGMPPKAQGGTGRTAA